MYLCSDPLVLTLRVVAFLLKLVKLAAILQNLSKLQSNSNDS